MRRHARRSLSGSGATRGLTLIEVVLVLALLGVIGAISIPLLEGSFSRAALYSGGDLLRGAWAQARLSAMQNGEAFVFRFEPNGSRFQIVQLNALGTPATDMLAPVDPENPEETGEFVRLSQNKLPDGIVFSGGDISSSARVMATLPGAEGGSWSRPILFYPDGTTSDASIVLANDRQVQIRVTLRGLTGLSQSADVESMVTP